MIYAPTLEAVRRIRYELENLRSKLNKNGWPIVDVSARELTEYLLEIDDSCMMFPAHIRKPWYGLLGSKSGFDFLDECFEAMGPYVQAAVTGLLGDLEMNCRVSAIADRSIVSFTDAHSLIDICNICRELTSFDWNPWCLELADGLKKT